MPAKKAAPKQGEEKVIAPKRRKLWELYVEGTEVIFDDLQGDPIVVWLQKVSPAEERLALREARSERSRIALTKKLPEDSPERLEARMKIEDEAGVDRKTLSRFILQEKLDESYVSIQEKIAAEEEWSKDDYLVGLQEAWNDGINEAYIKNPEDPEAKRVFEELSRYSDTVFAEYEADEADLIDSISHRSDEELITLAADRLIDIEANFAMVEKFKKVRLFYAVRDPEDHDERYFDSVEQVDLLQTTILERLLNEYDDLAVDSLEGKD